MKIEDYFAGYQHIYLSECERQLALYPTSIPYPRATMLFSVFAALNLALVFALMHTLFKLPITNVSSTMELAAIGLVVIGHVVLMPTRSTEGSNYMAYESAQIERVKNVRIAYSLGSSFVPFALFWLVLPKAI